LRSYLRRAIEVRDDRPHGHAVGGARRLGARLVVDAAAGKVLVHGDDLLRDGLAGGIERLHQQTRTAAAFAV
jgi:hypothetical protein